MAAGEQDLVLAYWYPLLAERIDPPLQIRPLAVDDMAIALPAGHHLADEPAIPIAALATEGWIAPHPCPCRDAFTTACRTAGFSPTVVSETNDYMAMLGLVGAGLGVAVVPRLVAAITVPDTVVLRPLAGSRLRRVVGAVTRAGGYRPAAVDQLLDILGGAVPDIGHPQLSLRPAVTVDEARAAS